jgi:hypothetical protein
VSISSKRFFLIISWKLAGQLPGFFLGARVLNGLPQSVRLTQPVVIQFRHMKQMHMLAAPILAKTNQIPEIILFWRILF